MECATIEEPDKYTELYFRVEEKEGEDRERTGQRSSAETCDDWGWRGIASVRRRTGMDGGHTLPDVQFCTGRTKALV